MDLTKEAYEKSIQLLEKCATPHGFYAAYPGYDAVWARDSMIISLGASLLGKKFQNVFKHSLLTLARNQSSKGQIPNAVDKFSKRKSHVDYMSIDSSLWFIIGVYTYHKKFHDDDFHKKLKPYVKNAVTWIQYRDWGEDHMIEQLPTTDWQDAFPHKYGHTINSQALNYKVQNLINNKKEAEKLNLVVNKDKDKGLWDKNFYLPWRWKNHNKYQEKGNWFDSLGNLLAINFDLADTKKSQKIFSYIKNKKIDLPYPVKAIYPAIKKGNKEWQDYFLDSDAGKPYNYSNAGIWGFIGGFYILALIKYKRFKEAQRQLEKLAEANKKLNWNFSEWLHGRTGKPSQGGGQGWNAAMYILAYESLRGRKVLLI